MVSQPRKKTVVYVFPRDSHAIRVFERYTLGIRVQFTASVTVQGINLLFRDTEIAADRSVDVLSKLTPIEKSYAAINQRFQAILY